MSYILFNSTSIIATEPRFIHADGPAYTERQIEEVLANYPQGTKIHASDVSQLSLADAKALYRVHEGEIIPRIIVSVRVEPHTIASDGIDESLISVFVYNWLPEEKKDYIDFLVDGETFRVYLNEQMQGERVFTSTKKGFRVLELDWPEADYAEKAVYVV